eukprot:NODE_625_length_5289_cov_0.416956.p6 type:complete len:128 gc:universal NODE_625_length_5289_cov_0.416956:4141-3758(-)
MVKIRFAACLICYSLIFVPFYVKGSAQNLPFGDKFLHFFAFFGGTIFLHQFLLDNSSTTHKHHCYFLSGFISLFTAIMSEMIQPYFGTHTFDIRDICCNIIGSVASLGLVFTAQRRKNLKKPLSHVV